jgi:hypothetical protein
MGVVEQVMTVIKPREHDAPLEVLHRAHEPSAAPRCSLARRTGDILRKHGPSLGKTPDPSGVFQPVILTGSRSSQRERTFD